MTTRQMAAIKDVLENKMPVSTAMVKNGYSPATAKNPDKLTKSDAWREVMNEYLPDSKLFKKHEEALDATKHVLLEDGNMVKEADHSIRLKAVEMAYKLKGRTGDNGGNIGQQFNIMMNSDGYIPTNNVLNAKPTKLTYKSKQAKH